MVGWHHRLDGLELEQVLGVGDGQAGLVCCSPWGRKELDVRDQVKNNLLGLLTTKITEGSRSSDFLWVCTIPNPIKVELAIATLLFFQLAQATHTHTSPPSIHTGYCFWGLPRWR